MKTVSPRSTLVITYAQKGEIINVSTVANEPRWVYPRCDHDRGLAYFCASCKEHLANGGQLEIHIEIGGSHHIVNHCPKHGYEEGYYPDLVQVEAFKR